jgi:hypothetical protein
LEFDITEGPVPGRSPSEDALLRQVYCGVVASMLPFLRLKLTNDEAIRQACEAGRLAVKETMENAICDS